MSDLAIETFNLSKHFNGLVAVDSSNLKVPRGKIFGFLGPNGAGKSTTISMLATILRPTSGTFNILGEPLNNKKKIKKLIGLCPQDLVMQEYLTAKENIELFAKMHGMKKRDYRERTDDLLGKIFQYP